MLSGLEAEEGVSGALVSMIVINWDYAAAAVASSVEKIFPFESTISINIANYPFCSSKAACSFPRYGAVCGGLSCGD